mgnify:CR=1 FL=1
MYSRDIDRYKVEAERDVVLFYNERNIIIDEICLTHIIDDFIRQNIDGEWKL